MTKSAAPKRILIACGGTGGHLAPGIALAQKLTSRGHECELLISGKQVDQRLIQKYPEFTFKTLPAVSLGKTHSHLSVEGFFKFVWSQFSSLWFCAKVIHNFKPHAVVGFGGFVTVSAGISAAMRGTPLFLHEANYKVGRTNRILSSFAKTIWVPVGIENHGLPPHKTSEMGIPLRSDMKFVNREEARKALGFPLRGKMIVVFGGSQGVSSLNRWANDNLEIILATGTHLYCIMGQGKGEARAIERQLSLGQVAKALFVPFSDQMHFLYSAADLFVARAGAGTISELIRFAVPSILIPYPHAADDHQRANAANLERMGGSIVVDEGNLDNLLPEVLYALKSDTLLEGLHANLSKINMGDPAALMSDAIEKLKSNQEPKAFSMGVDNVEVRFLKELRRNKISPDSVKLIFNEPMGSKTTFGIGGVAKIWVEPGNAKHLARLLKIAHQLHIPIFCLGRGSNLLVLDKGFEGMVIRLSQAHWQKLELLKKKKIKAWAGVRLKSLCGECTRMEMEGFEFMEGIPATLGGALRMNAGAFGGWMFERVEKVCYMTFDGKIHVAGPQTLRPTYRSTPGLKNTIVLWAILKPTQKGSADLIRRTIEKYQSRRKATQPRDPSAGSIFKNPSKELSAGSLIEAAGLKGLRVRDAQVSDVHANFIVNKGVAKASDVIDLMNKVRQEVWKTKKIDLQPEIMLLGGDWNDYLLPLRNE